MRLPSQFIRLPLSFDHQHLAEEISQFGEDEWRAHISGFKGNSSLVLVSTNGEENDDFSGPMKPSPRLAQTPYIRQIMGCFNSVIGRSRLMRLAPGASVTQHTDAHYFWRDHLRIHIPIVTTPDVAFYCDNEQVHMAAGESWTFNNWLEHSVENRSDQARIHLVIDTVGSSDLWTMIDGRNSEPESVAFDPAANPDLRFESFSGLPVIPPAELRVDLTELVDDVAGTDANDPAQVSLLRSRTADFIHDWHSHWMVHGTTLDGFAGFKTLRDGFRRDLTDNFAAFILGSNRYSFLEAANYTLDAALAPENLAPAESKTTAPASVSSVRFDRPVFIVAAPRSGSTLLFETLAVNRELWSIGDESHKHFESISSLRPSRENPSNRLTADMATADTIETLKTSFVADLVNCDGKPLSQFSAVSRPSEVRFLEKTPKNALRIPFILKAFPDARFIFLYRDARQNISSLLDSWRSRRYVTYPRLPGWPETQPWSHLLIPGWEELANSALAEVAAAQWSVTNRTILDDLTGLLPKERWCVLDYNALLANTHAELQRLCTFAEVIFGPRMHEIALRPLRPSKYTLTEPRPDKWKKNAADLEPVIPGTEALMAELRSLD